MEAITMLEGGGVALDMERCIRCGYCSNVCKFSSIVLKETSFDIFIGGSGGITPREATMWQNVPTEQDVIDKIDRLLNRYAAVAEKGERIGGVIARLGLDFLAEANHE
jgi:dissimilatory sulfite reductase (desulfoviridin) alpha/beta subunit